MSAPITLAQWYSLHGQDKRLSPEFVAWYGARQSHEGMLEARHWDKSYEAFLGYHERKIDG